MTFDEAKALVAKYGRQRFQFLMCQVCVSQHQMKADRPALWDHNPARVVHDWTARPSWQTDSNVNNQLKALALLVERHHDEYDSILAAFQSDELTARRKGRK